MLMVSWGFAVKTALTNASSPFPVSDVRSVPVAWDGGLVDAAARLVDEALPPIPVRQGVLSLPFEIRYRLAWDGKLMSAILGVFLRVVYGSYRHQAKQQGHAAVCPRRTVGRCQPSHPAPDLHHRPLPTAFSGPLR